MMDRRFGMRAKATLAAERIGDAQRIFVCLVLAAAATACTTARPEPRIAESCKLEPIPLKIPLDPDRPTGAAVEGAAGAIDASDFFLQALQRPRKGPITEGPAAPRRQLVLSGGGQHGSFGAGFLNGMPDYPGYDIVTGVSTGALQAPFALLGKEARGNDLDAKPEDDFGKGKKAGEPYLADLIAGYFISREGTLYDGKGDLGIVRKARYGTLDPLRRRTDLLVSSDTMTALAALENKQLYIALLNWDSGNAEIIDMMKLVRRFADGDADAKDLARKCFMEVMIAASSEPLGAPGVVIDDRLYFDAGLRYGVFEEGALKGAREYARRREGEGKQRQKRGRQTSTPAIAVETDLIRNGDLDLPAAENDEYSAIDIVKRGQKILANQVYAFSMKTVIDLASDRHRVRFAYISDEEMKAGPRDEKAVFDPQYMCRMMKVGLGRKGVWNRTLPTPKDKPPSPPAPPQREVDECLNF